MKKVIMVLVLGLLFVGVNLYAAEGDFIIEGNVGIGTETPTSKLNIVSTDTFAFSSQATQTTNFLTGNKNLLLINSSKDPNYFSQVTSSSAQYIGADVEVFNTTLSGSLWSWKSGNAGETQMNNMRGIDVSFQDNDINIRNYTIEKLAMFLARSSFGSGTGNFEIGNFTGIRIEDVGIVTNPQGSFDLTNLYGMFIEKQTKGTKNYGIVLDGDETGADIVFGEDQDAKIYWDGTNLYFSHNETAGNSNAIAYFSGTLTAEEVIERTSVWDKNKGKALDSLKDANDLIDGTGRIIHENFPEKVTYQVTDYDNCWEIVRKTQYCWTKNNEDICVNNISDVPKNITDSRKVEYKDKECAKKNETGVSMSMRAAKHEQALYEAYQLIKELQNELCLKENSYSWCK